MLSNKTSFLVPCCEVSYDFRIKTSLLPFVLDGVLFYLCCLYLFTYTIQSNTISIYHVIVATLNSNTTGFTTRTRTAYNSGAPEFTPSVLVRLVSLNRRFSMWCFVDHSVFFLSRLAIEFYGFCYLRTFVVGNVNTYFLKLYPCA